jgi:hypothetical protein
MHRERQTILSLLALGRITPQEAERLLAASSVDRDEVWVIVVFAAAGAMQVLRVITNLAHTIFPAMRHALAIVTSI